jgi:hypothetical protein
MVYVDDAIWPFGRMMMCHMLADSRDELHAMADKIGVSRRWFQDKTVPHYDLCKSKRSLALRSGAFKIDRWKMAELIKIYRTQRTPPNQNAG